MTNGKDKAAGDAGTGQEGPAASRPRKDRILDAAEALFAKHGFDGVTMRQVAMAASVDVALPNYHFGSKRGLFDAVLLRRAEVLNRERLQALEDCTKAAGSGGPAAEAIIDAFLRPLLSDSHAEEEGWRHYYELIAQVNNSPEWGGVLMTKYFDPLVRRFMEALKRALPQADEADIYWCYHFLSGALTLTFAQTGRIDHLSGGKCRSDDLQAAYERMVPFVAAGFRHICGGDPPS
ncbi:TetR/AcrR family transcriptional regulator [Eilatimonas milleporae]|uniref:TetR family transcriptional regulator n=1 Tax=Eilatimonas milleporae TaxID=911205 RepID=A0A3M0CFV9_9PROT|nr:TetR/AcrR family transcriptional regulator [Eilatimonas milleporae]RMB08488.1 TetR family transcriptional regulator [Eilatimonas milleporae]